MDHTSSQSNDANISSPDVLPQSFISRDKHCELLLLLLITALTISAIKIVQLKLSTGANWFITPAILITASVIPGIIKRQKLFSIGLSSRQIKSSLIALGWTCLLILPAMFCGLWLLKFYGLNFPLRPVLPKDQQLTSWLFYQFMYVAVAEEFFFRGFLQGSVLDLLTRAIPRRRSLQCCLSIVISAVCFAAAHMIVHESALSALIIAPGLILGWLYIKTNSLLAPILFHGIANAGYYFLAGILSYPLILA